MSRRFPRNPPHPERLCWGCDRYCAAGDLRCGNGSVRTPHPAELFGAGWDDPDPSAAGDTGDRGADHGRSASASGTLAMPSSVDSVTSPPT